MNQYGKGQAYYIASFAEDSFYLDFYQKLAGELALTRALPQLPPEGVEACLRESGDTQYLFLQNFTGEKQAISLPEGYVDLEGNPRRGGQPGPVRQPSVPAEQGVNPWKIPGGNHKTDGKNRRKIGGYGKIK